ncbi:unnamed protein product [Linum trigynum]|uniref:Uncharacterized protein n=1 Tax=Linum trigynum TaxID=586398 RepID=A0AAV2GU78_9ROSI
MNPVPINANPIRVSSPRSMANTAVAANVVALVTGTASEIGASLRRAKKVAEAERLIKKGMEYCQNSRRLIALLSEEMSFRWSAVDFGAAAGDPGDLLSYSRAPRRIKALVAPQMRPTATIFSTSPGIDGSSRWLLAAAMVVSLNRRLSKGQEERLLSFRLPDERIACCRVWEANHGSGNQTGTV